MKPIQRAIAGLFAISALVIAVVAYSVHAVRSSDHQDTYNLATRSNTSADITDVYIFPSPANSNNVVFVMNVSPLSPPLAMGAKYFDPSLIWQFKISHGATAGGPEDQVIQFGVNGVDATQQINVYGPAAPNEVGVVNTLTNQTGTVGYNKSTTLGNGVQVFAGPRADPFFFDLFQFFGFLGDRNYNTHTSQSDPGAGNAFPNINGDNVAPTSSFANANNKAQNPATPSFNFGGSPNIAAHSTSGPAGSGYACSTAPSVNTLADLGGGFNVLSFVVEVPRSLLTTGYSSSVIHVWATSNSSTGA